MTASFVGAIKLLSLEDISDCEPVVGYAFPTTTNDFKVKRNKNDSNKAPLMVVGSP